jgi:hypothetical protein
VQLPGKDTPDPFENVILTPGPALSQVSLSPVEVFNLVQ